MINGITKEDIDELPLCQFKGTVTIVEDVATATEVVELLKHEHVLGFDTETKPSFKKGEVNVVSLLQLATPTEVFLFRLNKNGLFPHITCLLESPDILKVGVGIRDDIRALSKLVYFRPLNFLEIQEMVKLFGIEAQSLKFMAAILLNARISKRQRLSNWEADALTPGQVDYAATDAWVALRLYQELTLLEPAMKVQSSKF